MDRCDFCELQKRQIWSEVLNHRTSKYYIEGEKINPGAVILIIYSPQIFHCLWNQPVMKSDGKPCIDTRNFSVFAPICFKRQNFDVQIFNGTWDFFKHWSDTLVNHVWLGATWLATFIFSFSGLDFMIFVLSQTETCLQLRAGQMSRVTLGVLLKDTSAGRIFPDEETWARTHQINESQSSNST